MKRFSYYSPHNLSEALEMRQEHPDALPLAGGTNLIVQMKEGQRVPAALLGLSHLDELKGFAYQNGFEASRRYGSLTSIARLAGDGAVQEHYTALWEASNWLGSVQTRNLATLGGNLCNASPSADTAPPLLALGAVIRLKRKGARRDLPLEEFFEGPGETALMDSELLVEISLPVHAAHSGSAYRRFTPRHGMDINIASAAAWIALDDHGYIQQARLALGSVAPTPLLASQASSLMTGQAPSPALFQAAAQAASQECNPIDDLRASADFRRHLVRILAENAIQIAIERANHAH